MNIPLVDLRAQHDEVHAEIDAAIEEVIDNAAFIGGPRVSAFEQNFAAYCGTRQAVACASGTDALRLSLMAAGVRPGEEVIAVPHTFIATLEDITLVGAYPALVDIDGPTYNLTVDRLAEFLEMVAGRAAGGGRDTGATARPAG